MGASTVFRQVHCCIGNVVEDIPPACRGRAHVIGQPKVDEVGAEFAVIVLAEHDVPAGDIPVHAALHVDVLDRLCQALQEGQPRWPSGIQTDVFAGTALPAYTRSAV